MAVHSKKILIVLTGRGKTLIGVAAAVILFSVIINTVIFANHGSNPSVSRRIIIDPGHGGIDGGTNDNSSFMEKNINLHISENLKSELESNKISAALTRDGDYSLEGEGTGSSSRHIRDLQARVQQFNSGKYDLFISIHVNYSSNSRAAGSIILYSPRIPTTKFLAQYLQDALNQQVNSLPEIDFKRSIVEADDLYILKNSNIPGVIVETGFISNPVEKSLLQNETHQAKLAKAICDGVKQYFKNYDILKDMPAKEPEPNQEEQVPSNTVNEKRLVESN